jgi:hypothetical protein
MFSPGVDLVDMAALRLRKVFEHRCQFAGTLLAQQFRGFAVASYSITFHRVCDSKEFIK